MGRRDRRRRRHAAEPGDPSGPRQRVEVTARGKLIRELEAKPDRSGQTVQLTIDAGLQDYAGRRMGELLKGKGTVLMLRYQEGSAATEEREAGFLAELKAIAHELDPSRPTSMRKFDAGADVVGVDWRIPLDEAARRVGPQRSLQGNLDPAVLLADRATVDREVRRVVEQGKSARGHIFNLGHGVLPDTDPDVITRAVELVHRSE